MLHSFMQDIEENKEWIDLDFEIREDKHGGVLSLEVSRDRAYYRTGVARRFYYDNNRIVIDASQKEAAMNDPAFNNH
jgi:hypothetical protein